MSIQPGTYRAQAIKGSAKLGYSNNGTEQVGVQIALLDADGVETDYTIGWYGYFTDGTFERTIESLRNMGWQGDDLRDLSTVGSKACEIVVDFEEYQGRRSLKVKFINSAGRRTVAMKNEMDASAVAAFAARMRGQVIATNGGKASRTATPSRPAAGGAPAARPAAPVATRAPEPAPAAAPAGGPPEPPPGFQPEPPPGAGEGFEDDVPF